MDASGVKRLMQQTIEFKGSGTKLTLLRELDFEGGEHIRWHFELKDNHIVGTIWSVHDSPKKWFVDWSGPIDLTRITP